MKMKNFLVLVVVAVIVIAGGVYMSKKGNMGERVVKIGFLQGLIMNLPAAVLRQSDILDKAGVKYEWVDISSSNTAFEAVARGDVDIISNLSALPVLLNYPKQPDVVRIFSASDFTVPDKFDSILVKKTSPIQSLQDLSGKKLKYGVYPGSTHIAFNKQYFTSQGIDYTNIEFIQLPPQNHIQSLESGAIDVLGTYDPITTIALDTGNYREIGFSVYANVFDHSPLSVGILNTKFMNEYPELAKKVVNAHKEARERMLADPANSHKILATKNKISQALADKIKIPTYVTNGEVDRNNFQKFVDYLFELKEIPQKVDTTKLIVNY